ncbi:MAG: hypothetical protein HPY57_15820 [Ignavibacteria bacterium]|nr:hypothetical protein [Ignavibacteria bacterium]
MAYFALSGITGCISPVTGITNGYDLMYNKDKITIYYKKDVIIDFINTYMVVVIFENYTQNFSFLTPTDRDAFYNSLPI